MELTEEQYKALIPYELHLHRAYYGQYVFGLLTDDAKTLFQIYNEVFKKNEKSLSCGRCRLNVTTALGRLYYEYQEAHPKNNKKKTTKKGK